MENKMQTDKSNTSTEEKLFLSNYQLISTLGKGSYGKVKLAEDTFCSKMVALKFMNKEKLNKDYQKERIRAETKILSMVDHDNICKYYRTIETDKHIVMELEYIQGKDLFDFIAASKKLDESVSRTLFIKILKAVEYLHFNRIIHRDLKPENIMVTEKQDIKLIDFRFSSHYDVNEEISTFCGSPYYASPEMILGMTYVGPEVDIWSLGAILYTMTHGKPPFEAEHVNDLYQRIIEGKYKIDPSISPGLTNLIKSMLKTDKHKRISLKEILDHPWINHRFYEREYYAIEHIDTSIIDKLIELGFEKKKIFQKLRDGTSSISCMHNMISYKLMKGIPLRYIGCIIQEEDFLDELRCVKKSLGRYNKTVCFENIRVIYEECFISKDRITEYEVSFDQINTAEDKNTCCPPIFDSVKNIFTPKKSTVSVHKENSIQRKVKHSIQEVEETIINVLKIYNHRLIKGDNAYKILLIENERMFLMIKFEYILDRYSLIDFEYVSGNRSIFVNFIMKILNEITQLSLLKGDDNK